MDAVSFVLAAFHSPSYTAPLPHEGKSSLLPVLPPRRPQDVSVNLKMVIGFQLKHSNPGAHLKALISRIGYGMGQPAWRQPCHEGLSHTPLTSTRLWRGNPADVRRWHPCLPIQGGCGTCATTVKFAVATPFCSRHMTSLRVGVMSNSIHAFCSHASRCVVSAQMGHASTAA